MTGNFSNTVLYVFTKKNVPYVIASCRDED